MNVRPMERIDVPAVVSLHMQTFPGFFLTFLGPRFLALLYLSILEEPDGVAFVAVEGDGGPVGFVAGVTQQARFYSRLARRHLWSFGLAAAGAVMKKPSIVPRLARGLRRSGETVESSAAACLMSIGVSPKAQGTGAGRRLVNAFADELRLRSIDRFCLTTDRDGNEPVNAFYRSLGFSVARTFTTPEGRIMNEYLMETPSNHA